MVGLALIFDTETTGLFQFKDEDGNSVPADADGQPRMLSCAAALVEPSGMVQDQIYRLIKPEGFEVDEAGEAFEVNGLSNELLQAEGIPVVEFLEMYDAFVDRCDFIAAFSIGFDQKMIRAEQRRAGRNDRYGDRDTFEMMYKARSLACSRGGPHSNPKKLSECHENIIGEPLGGAHLADKDLAGTIRIYQQMLIEEMVEPRPQVSKS